ncbi:hypothetical protein MICRO11B_40090 [Micrococcus luteus]|nr:hypothetical protein MICRO11B_40090 [Micrococcus luteus]
MIRSTTPASAENPDYCPTRQQSPDAYAHVTGRLGETPPVSAREGRNPRDSGPLRVCTRGPDIPTGW